MVVTDDSALAGSVLQILAGRGLHGVLARNTDQALRQIRVDSCDMVLADFETLDGRHDQFIRQCKIDSPELPIVMLSEDAGIELVVDSLRSGCEDFLTKSSINGRLAVILETYLPNRDVPMAASSETGNFCDMVGKSSRLLEAVSLAEKVAPTSIPVLITGESGTGKELISNFIHCHSNRANGPYIRVNCAALSESLLESELFGHERGAFTGANSLRKGRFERAHGGTLLLDEISETGPRLQAELLRVLEQQDFERVGGSESVSVNVRVICTSNKDLPAEIASGRFRADLYYRISGAHIEVPSLRDRSEDIPALIWHFVNKYAREVRRQITRIDDRMLKAFSQYHWPGNIRQLRNVVRASLIFGEGPVLSMPNAQTLRVDTPAQSLDHKHSLLLDEVERKAIFEALRRTNSHQAKAADLLGITDRTLREKLRRYRKEGHLDDGDGEEVACQTKSAT